MPKHLWTPIANDLIRRMWWDGYTPNDIVKELTPILGITITTNALRGQLDRQRYVRSPEALSKIRVEAHKSKLQPKATKEAVTQAIANLETHNKPKPEPKVPYQSLATKGPDPRRNAYLQQMKEGRKGRL